MVSLDQLEKITIYKVIGNIQLEALLGREFYGEAKSSCVLANYYFETRYGIYKIYGIFEVGIFTKLIGLIDKEFYNY